jgi:hypothetical protein
MVSFPTISIIVLPKLDSALISSHHVSTRPFFVSGVLLRIGSGDAFAVSQTSQMRISSTSLFDIVRDCKLKITPCCSTHYPREHRFKVMATFSPDSTVAANITHAIVLPCDDRAHHPRLAPAPPRAAPDCLSIFSNPPHDHHVR